MTRSSLADRAEDILRRHSKGAPMHYRRLTEIGIAEGLIVPGGPTPEASMNSAITQDIKKRSVSGTPQRFRSRQRGYFALARPTDPLHGALTRKNDEVRARLRELLSEMHPKVFEHLIGTLLSELGFEDVQVTRYVGDKGVDLRARLVVGGVTDVLTAIQAKRYTTSAVGAPAVRELRGGLGPHERGLIIALSRFSKDAVREASESDRSPITLVDGERLIDLLIDNQIGVSASQITLLEIDEAFFADESDEVEDAASGSDRLAGRPNTHRPQELDDRVRSLWPLPGGNVAWKDTLDSMVDYVASEAPSMATAIEWMVDSFERVASKKTSRGYWQVLRSFGLIDLTGEQLALTARGAEYRAAPASETLLALALARILGVEEMLGWLAERPMTLLEIRDRFNTDLGVEWSTTAQVGYRLGWLAILGAADQQGDTWSATTDPAPVAVALFE